MVQVLDCTLRDGGYYTNWDFKPDLVDTYIDSVSRLPIEYVELGYVNDDMDGYFGEYFFLRPAKLQAIRNKLRADQKLVVMLDGKSATPDRVAPLFAHLVGIVDGVRITANPEKLEDALILAREFKKLGLMVGFNIMYLSTYQDDLAKLQLVIDEPESYDSLALVDSYGGCAPAKVKYAIEEMRKLVPTRAIGFHGHDNMCLAFANTLAAIEGGADIVDGTFTGMGRGAGNVRTETVLIHLDREASNQDLDYQALANVVAPFEVMRKEYEWGTNLPYMLSGANSLPQKDVMDWLAKSRYSVISIIRALQQQSGQDVDRTVYPDVGQLGLSPKNALLVGGGPSVAQHADAIRDFVERHDAIVIFSSSRHLALASAIGGRQLLCLPGHDALRAGMDKLSHISAAVVAAPPRVPGCVPAGLSIPVHQAAPLASPYEGPDKGPVSDSGPMALGLGVVEALGADSCWLVGFDGYDTASLAEQELSREVQASLDAFAAAHGAASIASLTPTRYKVKRRSLHGLVAAV
jgi:4-hydroxy 2-oxovalerate aldolase